VRTEDEAERARGKIEWRDPDAGCDVRILFELRKCGPHVGDEPPDWLILERHVLSGRAVCNREQHSRKREHEPRSDLT
jgi:hypothetical protein